MATLTSLKVASDWLKSEAEQSGRSRKTITLASGQAAVLYTGTVLGQISTGTATSAAKSGGNTGNGTCTVDVTTPVLAGAIPGVYTVRITNAVTNAGLYTVEDPNGNPIGSATVGTTFADRIKFALADGATDFVVGDGFDITVTAGSGKFGALATAGLLGTQIAAGILLDSAVDATTGDVVCVAIVREAEYVDAGVITWPSGITSGAKATAKAQLAALGIHERVGI